MYNTIEITFKNGESDIWNTPDWVDCSYDDKVFIVKRNGAWIGFYNIDTVQKIIIKEVKGNKN